MYVRKVNKRCTDDDVSIKEMCNEGTKYQSELEKHTFLTRS